MAGYLMTDYCKSLYFHQYQFSSNCKKMPFCQYVNSSFQDFQNLNLLPGPIYMFLVQFIDLIIVWLLLLIIKQTKQ